MKNLIVLSSYGDIFRRNVIMFCLVLIFTDLAFGQPNQRKEFLINDFVVTVRNINGATKRTGMNMENFRTYTDSHPDIVFSGNGTIMFEGQNLNVSFSNIKVKTDRNNNLVATAGTVKGISRNEISYGQSEFNIHLRWKTMIIVPTNGSASISVKVPLHSCSSEPAATIILVSPECSFFSDGAISGDNFTGTTEFKVKKSVYSVKIPNMVDGTVKLGSSLSNKRPANGAYLKGKDILGLFDVNCFIAEKASDSRLSFKLLNVEERKLEYNSDGDQYYYVKLKDGAISFLYDNDTLTSASGQFSSRLALPKRYNAVANIPANQVIDTFDIILYTDETNALFDTINLVKNNSLLPYKFKSGTITFEPGKYKAWVYFPAWMKNSSRYDMIKDSATCEEITAILRKANNGNDLRCDKNPGLTITRGTIYLTSPQIDYRYTGSVSEMDAMTVKTYFSGYLTFTPYGLQGSLGSDGNTFVPVIESMDRCAISTSYQPFTWEQIISRGDTLPERTEALFRIQKINILEMRLKEMRICKDRLVPESTFFRYIVHFPHPSYMNLEFEDNSFTNEGKFSKAYGPVSLLAEENMSYRTTVINTDEGNRGKGEPIQVPSGYIFWAWRLPVTFADRSIEIDYRRLYQYPDSGITILMNDQNHNSLGEIYANELSVSPLYSDNSAFRKGVRFKGFLSTEGAFILSSWDSEPYFGKSYSKKFKCDLININLAQAGTSPTLRPFDFKWEGGLQFPFFCYQDQATWKQVHFQVKDVEPFMPSAINIESTERYRLKCIDGIMKYLNTTDALNLTVNMLRYDTRLSGFVCDRLRKGGTDRWGRLELFSYSHALFIENNAIKRDTILKTTLDNSCNNSRTVIEKLKDAYLNNQGITDLVCFDQLASSQRSEGKNNSSCCDVFYYGTYQIITSKQPGDSIVTLSATNARYYPFEPEYKLSFENSIMAFKSDDTSEGADNIIDIPGMQLASTEQGYFGAFGSTYTDVAFSLPYEGEFRFFLDPNCGYFYMLGAGSFTIYGIPLRGQVFLFHAPRKVFFTNPFPSYNTTSLLEDMTIRSLSDSVSDFLKGTQLYDIEDNTVVTGFLSTGAASYSKSWDRIDFTIQAGITNYFYHSNGNNFRTGMFGNVEALANLEVRFFSVDVKGRVEFTLGLAVPMGDFSNIIGSISQSDLVMSGELYMRGCIGLTGLGECCAAFRAPASMSPNSGFKIDKADLFCDCEH